MWLSRFEINIFCEMGYLWLMINIILINEISCLNYNNYFCLLVIFIFKKEGVNEDCFFDFVWYCFIVFVDDFEI